MLAPAVSVCSYRARVLFDCFAAPFAYAQDDKPAPPCAPGSEPSPSHRPANKSAAQGEENRPRDPDGQSDFNGLRFRSIGPAFTSGA